MVYRWQGLLLCLIALGGAAPLAAQSAPPVSRGAQDLAEEERVRPDGDAVK